MNNFTKYISIDFIVIFGGRLFNGLLLLVATRLYSSLLSDLEIGRLGVILSIIFFISSLIFFPVGSYINQNMLAWIHEKRWQTYISTYFFFITSLFLFAIYPLKFFIDINLLIIACIYLCALCFNQTLIPILNIMLYRKIFVFLVLLTTLVYILSSFYLVKNYHASAEFWLLGQSLANFVFSFFAFLLIKNLNKESLTFLPKPSLIKKTKKLFKFAVPVMFTSFAGWIILNFYKILAGNVMGLEAIAALIVCSILSAGVFGAIESATIQLYHANFLQDLDKSNELNMRRTAFETFFKKVMLVLTIFLVILLFTSPLIIYLGLDQRFHKYAWLLALFLCIDYLRNFNHIISQFAFAEFTTKLLVKGNLVGLITSVLLVFLSLMLEKWLLFIPISIIIAYIFNIAFQYIRLKDSYGEVNIFPNAINSIIIVFMIFFGFSSSFFYY